MKNALKFKQPQVAKQNGEIARFKVIQGADLGSVYVIYKTNFILGRGEECDIILSDLKASRRHAEVSLVKETWQIKDSGSGNGLVLNGEICSESDLLVGDVLTLGETALEFTSADAETKISLTAPKKSESLINRLLEQFQGRFKKPSKNKATSSVAPNPTKKKPSPLTLAVVGLGLAFMLFGGDGSSPKKQLKPAEKGKAEDLAAFLPHVESNKTADTLFREGMREYFLGNFTRAKNQFETVLQIIPTHELAKIYLENSNKSLEGTVQLNLERGKKSFQAGKLREARGNFERVMRILFRDQKNSAYIEAKEQAVLVTKALAEESF